MSELLQLLTMTPKPPPIGLGRVHQNFPLSEGNFIRCNGLYECGKCHASVPLIAMHVLRHGTVGTQCLYCYEMDRTRRYRNNQQHKANKKGSQK